MSTYSLTLRSEKESKLTLQELDENFLYLEELTQKGPSGVYTALLNQTESNPPVATVIDNTLGDITFEYNSTGEYRIKSDGLFTQDKTFFISQVTQDNTPQGIIILMNYADTSTIHLNLLLTGSGHQDGFLLNTPIEIRVYP